MKIHQVAAGFQKGDAISNEMVAIQSLLKKDSIFGEIYSENIGNDPEKFSHRISKLNPNSEDRLVYHHSIETNAIDSVKGFKCKKIFVYHNVTPSHFFEPYDLKFSLLLKKGKERIPEIAHCFDKFLAVSEFNKKELQELGIKNVDLFPLHLALPISADLRPKEKGSKENQIQFLFVGRIAPNKKQDDLIRFAYTWKSMFGTNFKIKMIGFCNPSLSHYLEELNYMIRFFSLQENITITPYATEAELEESYRESDFFLSMSEHEGFCVPLLESMYFGLPVIAYDGGAVKETLGNAGVLFKDKDFTSLALFLKELLTQPKSIESLRQGQDKRLQNYLLNLKNYSPKVAFLI
jgi:L-malate glycosyltransferase